MRVSASRHRQEPSSIAARLEDPLTDRDAIALRCHTGRPPRAVDRDGNKNLSACY